MNTRATSFRRAALLIGGLCAAFWLWFGIASAIGEQAGLLSGALHVAVPGGILVALLLLACNYPRVGGASLGLIGVAVIVGYPLLFGERFPLSTVLLVTATMGLPPLVAGGLFLLGRDRERPPTVV